MKLSDVELPSAHGDLISLAGFHRQEILSTRNHFSQSLRFATESFTCLNAEPFSKWRSIIFYLRQNIRDVLSQDGPVRRPGQSHQRNHLGWCKVAKDLASLAQVKTAG